MFIFIKKTFRLFFKFKKTLIQHKRIFFCSHRFAASFRSSISVFFPDGLQGEHKMISHLLLKIIIYAKTILFSFISHPTVFNACSHILKRGNGEESFLRFFCQDKSIEQFCCPSKMQHPLVHLAARCQFFP